MVSEGPGFWGMGGGGAGEAVARTPGLLPPPAMPFPLHPLIFLFRSWAALGERGSGGFGGDDRAEGGAAGVCPAAPIRRGRCRRSPGAARGWRGWARARGRPCPPRPEQLSRGSPGGRLPRGFPARCLWVREGVPARSWHGGWGGREPLGKPAVLEVLSKYSASNFGFVASSSIGMALVQGQLQPPYDPLGSPPGGKVESCQRRSPSCKPSSPSRGRLQHSRNCPEGGGTCALSEMRGQLKIFPSW